MDDRMWEHYRKAENKFKIIKYLKNRETAILTPDFTRKGFKSFRDIRVHNVQAFDFMLRWAGLNDDNRPVNIYHSLARYEGGLPYGWTMEKRRLMREEWEKDRIGKMTAYDFVIDIDAPTHDETHMAQEDAIRIYDIFRKDNPKIRFSGRGFHIYIRYEDMCNMRGLGVRRASFDPDALDNIYDTYYMLAKQVHDNITEFIDLSIYDSRRLIKCPDTLVFYSYDDVYLCKELSYDELKSFKLEDYKVRLWGASDAKKKDNEQ